MPKPRANPILQTNAWALVPLALATAAVIAPYCFTHGLLYPAFALQHGFALVCHQRPDRCFWVFGAPVAVCARCLGIYLGAAAGLVMRTSRAVAIRLLLIAAALNLVDVVTEYAGLHGNWMIARFGLGMMLGVAGALLIAASSHCGLQRDAIQY